MKPLAVIICSLLILSGYGQEKKPEFDGHKWEAPYSLPAPEDWAIERFPIPISFAPQISYKGVEDIRFTPGWGKANSDEYWSYAFLWYLEGAITMDSKTIDNNLKAYYTGLIGANGRNIPSEKLIPVETSFSESKKDNGDLRTFLGTIRMLDYMRQQPVLLNCKAHLKSCPGENKTFIFYELSPQPLTHPVWQRLDQLWLGFKCKNE
jgi:hypothetical protein